MTGILNARILASVAMLVFVGAAVASSTGAFFSDTETSTGNTFTAGDIDLRIDNESYVTNNAGELVASPANSWALSDLTNQLFFSFEDVKPGDIGEDTISLHPGTNDAYACMALDVTATPENGINDPEADAGDVTDGAAGGELQNFLNFTFWEDDGDNVFESGESVISTLNNVAASAFVGQWHAIADSANGPAIPGNSTAYVGKAWCFGTLAANAVAQDGQGKTGSNGPTSGRGTGFTCSGVGNQNVAQTDGIIVDVSFEAVQARNNGQFSCTSLAPFNGTSSFVEVEQQDLYTTNDLNRITNGLWMFYNDSNDTVMTIDQFGAAGQNHMASVLGVEGAFMKLHDVGARYNIATYKYKDVKLADISSIKYRIYDASASSQTPYLHFNVDLLNNDTWQGRLVQVPSGVVANTWTTVDALAGMWTKTSGNWPAPINEPGSNPKTWAQIVAAYPNAETRSTDSFLGVRVGHPGPAGEESYVDWIQFNGEMTDFVI